MADNAQFSEVLEITVDPSSFTDGLAQIESAYDDFVARLNDKGFGGSSVFDIGSMQTISEGIKAIQTAVEELTAAMLSQADAISNSYAKAFGGVAEAAKSGFGAAADAAASSADEIIASAKRAAEEAGMALRSTYELSPAEIGLQQQGKEFNGAQFAFGQDFGRELNRQLDAINRMVAQRDLEEKRGQERIARESRKSEEDKARAIDNANTAMYRAQAQNDEMNAKTQRAQEEERARWLAGWTTDYNKAIVANEEFNQKRVEADAAALRKDEEQQAEWINNWRKKYEQALLDNEEFNRQIVETQPTTFFGGLKQGLAAGGDLSPAGIGQLLGWVVKFNLAWKVVNSAIYAATVPLREFSHYMRDSWEYAEKLQQAAANMQVVLAHSVFTEGGLPTRLTEARKYASPVVQQLQMFAAAHGIQQEDMITAFQAFSMAGGNRASGGLANELKVVESLVLAAKVGSADNQDFRQAMRNLPGLLDGTLTKRNAVLRGLGMSQQQWENTIANNHGNLLQQITPHLSGVNAAAGALITTQEDLIQQVKLMMDRIGASILSELFTAFSGVLRRILAYLQNPEDVAQIKSVLSDLFNSFLTFGSALGTLAETLTGQTDAAHAAAVAVHGLSDMILGLATVIQSLDYWWKDFQTSGLGHLMGLDGRQVTPALQGVVSADAASYDSHHSAFARLFSANPYSIDVGSKRAQAILQVSDMYRAQTDLYRTAFTNITSSNVSETQKKKELTSAAELAIEHWMKTAQRLGVDKTLPGTSRQFDIQLQTALQNAIRGGSIPVGVGAGQGITPPSPATVATNSATTSMADYKAALSEIQRTTEAFLIVQHQKFTAGTLGADAYLKAVTNSLHQEQKNIDDLINSTIKGLQGISGLAPATLQKDIATLEAQKNTLAKSILGQQGAATTADVTANTHIADIQYAAAQHLSAAHYSTMAKLKAANATTQTEKVQIEIDVLRKNIQANNNIFQHHVQAMGWAKNNTHYQQYAAQHALQQGQLENQLALTQAGLVPAARADLLNSTSYASTMAQAHVGQAQTAMLIAQGSGNSYRIQEAALALLQAHAAAAQTSLSGAEQLQSFDMQHLGHGTTMAQVNADRIKTANAMNALNQATIKLTQAMGDAAGSVTTITHDMLTGNVKGLKSDLSWHNLTHGNNVFSSPQAMQAGFGKVYGTVTGIASAFHNQGVGQGIGASVSAIGGAVGGPWGAAISGIGDMISVISDMFTSAARHIAENIHSEFVITQNKLQADQINLSQALTQTEQERTQAIQQLSGQKGGQKQLSKLLPQLDATIASMKLQVKETIDSFQQGVMEGALNGIYGSTELSDFAAKWVQINNSVEKYLNAVGTSNQSIAEANKYVSEMLQEIQAQDQQQLLQGEQQAIQNAQDLNRLLLQRVQLEEQYRQQVFGIQNADAIERNLAPAVRVGQQLAMVQQQYQQQMLQLNSQIALKQQEVTLEQKVFNIATDTVSLYNEANQVALDMMQAQVEKWQQIQTIVNGITKGANGQYTLSQALGSLVVPIGNINPSEFTPFSNNGTINITVQVPPGSDGEAIGQSVAAALQAQAHRGMNTYGLPNYQGR